LELSSHFPLETGKLNMYKVSEKYADNLKYVCIDEMLERINKCLKEKNIKKGDLLTELDINKNAFSTWGKGKIPSLENILKVAHYLDVSIDWLLEGKIENGLMEDEWEVVNLYKQLPEFIKPAIREQLRIAVKNEEARATMEAGQPKKADTYNRDNLAEPNELYADEDVSNLKLDEYETEFIARSRIYAKTEEEKAALKMQIE